MKITKDMPITTIVQKYPEAIEILLERGMGCIGCAAARFENLEQGALAHGVDADELVADLNKALEE